MLESGFILCFFWLFLHNKLQPVRGISEVLDGAMMQKWLCLINPCWYIKTSPPFRRQWTMRSIRITNLWYASINGHFSIPWEGRRGQGRLEEAVSSVPCCYHMKVPVSALLVWVFIGNRFINNLASHWLEQRSEFTHPCSWFYLQGQEEEQAFTPALTVYLVVLNPSSKMSVATAILAG